MVPLLTTQLKYIYMFPTHISYIYKSFRIFTKNVIFYYQTSTLGQKIGRKPFLLQTNKHLSERLQPRPQNDWQGGTISSVQQNSAYLVGPGSSN